MTTAKSATATGELARITDPVARAREASVLLGELADTALRVRRVREAAVGELSAAGWSFATIAAAVGVSRSRAQQLVEASRLSGLPQPTEVLCTNPHRTGWSVLVSAVRP